jgi:GAF domain-containing protein
LEPVAETDVLLRRLSSVSGDTGMRAVLMDMGQAVVAIAPDCVGLSVGLVEEGMTFTLVASSIDIATLDATQYLEGGPCLEAERQRGALASDVDGLLDEGRWLVFAQASAAVGIASTLSVPIMTNNRAIGGVNLYASTPDAFEEKHEQLARAVGGSARDVVTNADLGFTSRHRAAQAPAQLAEQHDIDVALGIIVARQSVSMDVAQEHLTAAARRAGITEGQLAQALKHLMSSGN